MGSDSQKGVIAETEREWFRVSRQEKKLKAPLEETERENRLTDSNPVRSGTSKC
jgi:hypothetical protein